MTEEKIETFNDPAKIFAKIVSDVTQNHAKIIDDWCKAYLAHLVEKNIPITPDCLTLFQKQPNASTGELIYEYWFELREKQESPNDKLLKRVMERLNSLIMHIHERMKECRGKSDKSGEMIILHEIENFLNFVDKEEE